MRLWSPRARLGALTLVFALALPATALAAPPTGGGLTTPTPTTSTVTTTTSSATTAPPVKIPTTTSGSGLSTFEYVLLGLVVVIIFGAIVYFIRHDAHAHQPRHADRDIFRGRGTVAPAAERRKRARAKAKAARRARRGRR